MDCDAVTLFVERARAVLPGFTVTEDNAEAVTRLCRTLDGIPLAIELAAVRLRALSARQIADVMEDRLHMLSLARWAAVPRHETLEALVSWSFDLLSPHAQQLWERMSVFSGGFDLESAEAVFASEGLDREQILHVLADLVDRSILIREDVADRTRYRLLETIRQYGACRLASSGEETRLRRRHRDRYLWFARHVEAEWFGPDQLDHMARLRAEHKNISAALEYCLSAPDEGLAGLELTSALWFFWIGTGFLTEGRRWLEALLDRCPEPSPQRVKALAISAKMAAAQGDLPAALQAADDARALEQRLNGRELSAYTAHVAGMAAMLVGRSEQACVLLNESLEEHRECGDHTGMANDLLELGSLATVEGHPDRAIDYLEQALSLSEERGDLWLKSHVLCVLAMLAWQKGEPATGGRLARESALLKRSFNDRFGTAFCLATLSWVAADLGEYERAAQLLGILQRLWDAFEAAPFPNLSSFHETCVERSCRALGAPAYRKAFEQGRDQRWEEALAFALGEEAATPQRRGSAPSHRLTRRESEVAELIAAGMTDKEIAAELVIAQRTAEGHVQRLLRKLGFSSRSMVAAWVVEQRLAGTFC